MAVKYSNKLTFIRKNRNKFWEFVLYSVQNVDLSVFRPKSKKIKVYIIMYCNTEALVAATREIGLELSADKTKYMAMSRNQNAGRIQSVRIDNSTFGRVKGFKYLGTTLTNKNSIAEEIKSRLRSGNACYHSVQNLLSSRLLSKKCKDQDI